MNIEAKEYISQGKEDIHSIMDEAEMLLSSQSSSGVEVLESLDQPGSEPLSNAQDAEKRPLPNDGVPLALPARPALRRDKTVPLAAPKHLPPPAPPAPLSDLGGSTDSLSLAQLRKLVKEMPRLETTPYDFTYQDAGPFPEELEEWFSYNVEEQAMLLKTQESFTEQWMQFNRYAHMNSSFYNEGGLDWTRAEDSIREEFFHKLIGDLEHPTFAQKLKSLESLVYLLLGCWYETAEHISNEDESRFARGDHPSTGDGQPPFSRASAQIEWIKTNVQTFVDCNGLPSIFEALRTSCLRACGVDAPSQDISLEKKEEERREVWCGMTLFYVILEIARLKAIDGDLNFRAMFCDLKPNLLLTMLDIVSRLRWDESIGLPLAKVLLLTWKSILVCFGPLSECDRARNSFRKEDLEQEDKHGQPIITASPLDYHLFRQEISSKYPAYNPPAPLFALEPENSSILPPLKNHPSKVAGSNVFGSGLPNLQGNVTSILHQPVHIATPAPSPPPSPAGPGGKGGKKQNYQTNQLFPFLYPPLDESSNNLGGKGSTDLQDILVGRKWKGSDIPISISEAAEIFAARMKATRGMKQLWQVRVEFMKYERGWTGPESNEDVEQLDLDGSKEKGKERAVEQPSFGSSAERLQTVELFYEDALPQLQSLVLVLVKVILAHVTNLVTQSNGVLSNGLQSGFQYQEHPNGILNGHGDENGFNGMDQMDISASINELDALRTQDILDKAMTGILLLLLKWFKVSHILQFEYLTQLLVDSSYIPLVLKLLQLQEIEKVINYKCDRQDLNFFTFCQAHCREIHTDDSDSAAPPPVIKRRRDSPSQSTMLQPPPPPPEVDELGFPTTAYPPTPITSFSRRAFFTHINYLRILQKICKRKAHRNLMLVSYKSSQYLRKLLKVPQPELRLYTLKLFKNQVPYCGRKWRQTNMRVITAVYLHCRPELRDEWLAGGDVDAEVEDSVPLEQSLRALTHWWHLKHYPERMGAVKGVLEGEMDFFRRELEKMDWGVGEGTSASGTGDDVDLGAVGNWGEGQVDGW